jgi:hypothetical protein
VDRDHLEAAGHSSAPTRLRPEGTRGRARLLIVGAALVGLVFLLRPLLPGGGVLTDAPPGPDDGGHWTDARTAHLLVSRWLQESPGTPTLTIPRREVAWLKQLTGTAAQQAEADQKEREARSPRKKAPGLRYDVSSPPPASTPR